MKNLLSDLGWPFQGVGWSGEYSKRVSAHCGTTGYCTTAVMLRVGAGSRD